MAAGPATRHSAISAGSEVGILDVLNAKQLYLSAQLTLVQAEATRFSDVAALFQAPAEDSGIVSTQSLRTVKPYSSLLGRIEA